MMTDVELQELLHTRLKLRAFPELDDMRLWLAHPGSRLAELSERFGGHAPYWGFPWPGGLALARHILDHPQTVAGRRVLDFGAGCGVAGIAAHLSGAASVTLCDSDMLAAASGRLNAAENGLQPADLPPSAFGDGDVVLAGDVFYTADAAAQSLVLLSGFCRRGAEVLIGDPFRPDLPSDDLMEIARTEVREVGAPASAPPIAAGIFRLRSAAAADETGNQGEAGNSGVISDSGTT